MTHKKPTVSIGMPVYNGEKYLRTALDSLLAQTHRHFCLIISDNASTDGTEAICRAYIERDPRVVYFRQPLNIGAAANFQFTLDQANAEFFMWAAHDDYWAPRFLEEALKLLEDPAVGFVFPSFRLKSIRYGIFRTIPADVFKCIEAPVRDHRVLGFCNLHHSSHKCNLVYSVFRRSILKSALTKQDVSNDGLLSMAILDLARGRLMQKALFAKRYEYLWPGFWKKLWVKRAKLDQFAQIRDASFAKAQGLFPEYAEELEHMRSSYHYNNHNRQYRIIEH